MGNSGWNRPAANQPTVKKDGVKTPSKVKGIVAGVIVVVVGAVCIWMFSGENEKSPSKEKAEKSHVRDVSEKKEKESVKVQPKSRHDAKWKPEAEPDKTANVPPPAQAARDVIEFGKLHEKFFGRPLFKSRSDNFLAGLLSATPGDCFIEPSIPADFDEQFKKSLNDKIERQPEDTEDDIAVKEAVMAVKDQLKACLDKGQAPSEVVQDAYDDLRKVYEYREQLQNNLALLREAGSVKDVEDYLAEANEMLKEYNSPPIVYDDRFWEKLKAKEAQKKQEKQEKQEGPKEEL